MDTIGEKDCNSRELARLLIGSVQRLLNLKQWTDYTRLQAIDDPFRFIDEVAKHAEVLEKEDESKGGFHLRIKGISVEGVSNKIACIKTIRHIMGWGLADSKNSCEALPGSGHSSATKSSPPYSIWTRAFVSNESLYESKEYAELMTAKNLFHWEIARMPSDTPVCEPFQSSGY